MMTISYHDDDLTARSKPILVPIVKFDNAAALLVQSSYI